MANLKNKLNQLADKTKQAAEQKAKTTTTTTKKSSGAGAAVSNITQAAQAAVQNKQQGSQGVTQASINRMEKAAQQNPNQTIADRQKAIRSGQKVTASPTQTAKPTITAGRESTTPLAKAAGSSNIKNKLVQTQIKTDQRRKANLSRLGKDSTIGRDFGYTRDRDLTAVTITPAQQLNSLATRINDNEQQLINWGRRLSVLKAKANRGDEGAVASYNLLADKYNAAFEDYVSDIGAYNKLYNGEFRDSAVRGKYASREYMQQRQANRDLGARRSYQQRLMEEEISAPQETTLRRKGASVGEHSYKRISGEEPREAGYTFTHEPTRLQQVGRATWNTYAGDMKAAVGAFYRNSIPEGGSVSGMNSEIGVSDQSKAAMQYWSNELLSSGREQSQRGQAQQKLATQGLGAFGTFIVDSSIAGIQMMMDMGISVVTGGSMLPAMFVRSMGGGYLTAEEMGANSEAALAYGIGVGAVEALSEKMFSVFGIANRFAAGAVSQEMSERVIDRLVKDLASTPEGKAALSRMFTLLFATGSEGLEEVAAEVLEPVIRKFTLDPKLDISSEIDWESALYQGLVGAFLGGIGGAVELKNTRGTYWKYYKEGIDEGIQRYEAAVRKYGLESKEAMAAAKDVWSAGNKKMNAVAGTIDGRPVTYHQLAALEEARAYGRQNGAQGPSLADSLNPESLGRYLDQQQAARQQERDVAASQQGPEVSAGSANRTLPAELPTGEAEGETVRLHTARSAQAQDVAASGVKSGEFEAQPQTSQGGVDLSSIPEDQLTQEERDELQYGSGAVEDLGQYTGLAQRLGAPAQAVADNENAADEGGGEASFSIVRTRTMPWRQQVKGYFKKDGSIRSSDSLYLGESEAFIDGVPQAPLYIPTSVITKATRTTTNSRSGHSLSEADIESLRDGIDNAVAVIVNPSRNALVYITNQTNAEGQPIVVSFDLNNDLHGETAHKATSIHRHTSVDGLLNNLGSDATVYVRNENRLDQMLSGRGIYSSQLLAQVKSINGSITRNINNSKEENNNGQLYDGSSQRDAGERGREGSGSLGGAAEGSEGGQVPAQRGSDGGAAEADRGIQRVRKNEKHKVKIEKRRKNGAALAKTSGEAEGIDKTDGRTTMQILTEDMVAADAELSEIRDRLEDLGYDVRFHLGPIGLITGGEARGAHQNGTVWIRVDDPKWTATQISKHEELHGEIKRAPGLLKELLAKLRADENLSRLNAISKRYQEALLLKGKGEDEQATRMLEEMVCDLYAGMNEFSPRSAEARSLHDLIKEEVNSRQAESSQETRGPPADGEVSFALVDVSVPTREELDAKPDLPVIDIRPKAEESIDYKTQRTTIKAEAENGNLYQMPHLNEDTGVSLFVTPGTLEHIYRNWGLENIALTEHLPELIRTAVLTHAEQSRKHGDLSTGVYTFFAAVNSGRGIRPAELKVKEYYLYSQDIPKNIKEYFDRNGSADTYARLYDSKVLLLEEIKEELNAAGEVAAAHTGSEDQPTLNSSTISVKELLDLVKGDAAKYVPQYGQETDFSEIEDTDAEYMAAVKSGDMETARRMVEEAAKAAGYDLHLYHGSRKGGGFTVFRDWQYFTENKKYAERYQQRDNDDSLYEVYARSDRMFDTRNADDQAVFEQYRGEYGMGELQESGLPDWTDGYDISEMIEENDLDYDGIIVDEGGDLVDGEPVSRGPSYVLRKSNQIKSAEPVTYDDNGDVIPLSKRFDRNNPDVRFSEIEDEEETVIPETESEQAQANAPQTAGELIAAAAAAKRIGKQTERILRKIDLTEKEQGLVNALLSGALTVGELPSGINRRAVIQAYEAKKAARDAAAPVEEYNKQHRELLNEEARDACQNSTDWKNKKFELGMEAETPRRIFYGLTKDEAEAEKLNRIYVDPIREHHAMKVRMIKQYGEQIEALHIDKKRRHGNKVSEDYAVQYVGELEFIIDWLEDLPEGETRGGVTYDEAKSLLYEFWKENPNLDKDHIRKAVAEFRRIYDEVFAMWNEARVLNGYAPVDYRKGYFPHFTSRSMDTIVQAMARGMGFGVEVAELPTDIAGLTHMFKPGTQWSGHALERTGNKTDYSALEGWDRYIETVGNVIYHTEDIQRWRVLERTLRYKHGTPGVRDEMDKIRKDKDLTEAEREAEFDKLLGKEGKPDVTHLSAFVRWLNEYTNYLAGKRHLADRIVEDKLSREWYQRIQRLENLVGFNMLAGNIASVTTNFAPIFQALGGVRSTSMLQAIGSYAIGKVQHDVWRDGSDFLVNRKGYDPLYTNAMGKVKNAMFASFNWVDDFVSEVVVRAKYIDELRNGASPEEAMRTADVFAGSVIADRTVGELPVLYNSKTFKVFTMFQVEVNNDLRFLLKDMPREARKNKKVTALVLFRSLLRYLLAVYTFNDLFEALFGRRVTFDPLNTLNDLAGVAFGKKLPNGFEVMAEWIRTKEAPDWDTLFDAEHSDKPLSELAAIGEDVAGDLPFVAGLFGGGRYPVFAFLPNRSQTQSGFAAWEDLLFTHENDTKYDWQQIYKMNRNALTYLQPIPFIPGGQVRRTAEGIMAAAKGGSYNLTKKGEILQYPILTTYDIVKAAIFGKNTTKGGKEWVKSDFDSLSVEETEAYSDLVTAGSDGQKIYDILRDLHGDDRDAVTKAYALASANLKDSERIRLLDALVSESQGEKFAAMMTDGDLTFRQCAEVYEKYHQLSKMGELKDANDDYVYKKTVLATQFSAWLDDEGYSDDQKAAITEQYKFWNMVPAEAGNYEKLTAAGVSRDNAVDLTSDWSELEPLPDEDEVKDFQKIAVVASAGYLSEKEKHYAIRSLLKDEKNKSGVSPQDKYTTHVMDYHIPAEVYSQYCTLSYGVTGDDLDGDGKSDAYTKCDKLFAIIDRLPLSNGQKTALAIYKGGVSESTVYKRAPWLR